jgi:catechol 2,3-dioxygenase-like lactoylglutathione lyase family enzyme
MTAYPMRRVIIFTHNIEKMRDFYRDIIGLEVVEEDEGWIDMASGECKLALLAASPHVTVGPDFEGPHKLAFYAEDVVTARENLISRGAKMGPVHVFGDLHLCDGDDPDENRIQLSNRA